MENLRSIDEKTIAINESNRTARTSGHEKKAVHEPTLLLILIIPYWMRPLRNITILPSQLSRNEKIVDELEKNHPQFEATI